MVLGGLDIATTTGLAVCDGELITASSFRPRAKRPFDLKAGEVDYNHEGKLLVEFKDYLRGWLINNQIEAVAIEQPMRSNKTFMKATVNKNAGFFGQAISYEEKGGTQYNIIFRLYTLVGAACEVCSRLNVNVKVVNNTTWRKSFLGDMRPPRGHSNPSQWWKEQAKRQCERLKVDVPNTDAADSVGIVWWLRGELNPRLSGVADDLFKQRPTVP
jgi:hypothetical protein